MLIYDRCCSRLPASRPAISKLPYRQNTEPLSRDAISGLLYHFAGIEGCLIGSTVMLLLWARVHNKRHLRPKSALEPLIN